VLTYVLYDTAPRYLGPLNRVADLPGRRALPSASISRMVVPSFRLSTVSIRTLRFCSANMECTARLPVPEDVISAPSLSTFRRRRETFLFQQSYLNLVIWLHWHHSDPGSDFSYISHSKNYWTELSRSGYKRQKDSAKLHRIKSTANRWSVYDSAGPPVTITGWSLTMCLAFSLARDDRWPSRSSAAPESVCCDNEPSRTTWVFFPRKLSTFWKYTSKQKFYLIAV